MSAKRRRNKQFDAANPFKLPSPVQNDHSKELVELFNRLQMDDMSTGTAVGKLKKLYDNFDKSSFFDHLVFMIQVPLVNGTSKERPNKYDEKILQVVSSFAAASLDDETRDPDESTIELPWILRKVFDWLLDHHEVQGSGARLRICMMINWLLKNLGLHAEIDEILYKKIHDNMMERMQDKVAEIRAQAVTALQRLQDPTDSDCPIIRAYLRHLKFDPSPLVRRTVVKCIGASKATLRPILERTRDVDDLVRKAAYKFVAEKVSIRILSIGEREEILRQGLTDRNSGVQKVVEKDLVPTWLQICNGNVVELLHAIDVGNSDGKTATEICRATFSGVPYDQLSDSFKYLDPATRLVPLAKLAPETVTYWKNMIAFLHAESEKGIEAVEEQLDKLLPELTHFCTYVRDYVINHMGKVPKRGQEEPETEVDEEEQEAYEVAGCFVAKQLIEMTSYFDMADEVGRQNLCRLCRDLLANRRLHAGFVESLMKVYNSVQKNVETRISEIAEIISDLRDPLISSQTQQMQQQPSPHPQQQQQKEQEEQEEEPNQMNMTMDEMNEKDREEEMKRLQAETKRNEEALRRKRVQLAKLRLKMNIVKDEMDTAVVNQEFVAAQEKKMEFDQAAEEAKNLMAEIEQATAVHLTPREPERTRKVVERPCTPPPASPVASQSQPQTQTQSQKDDPDMILKSLVILSDLMRCQDINNLNPTLQTLLDEFIVPCVKDLNYDIREAAVKAMGCACLRSLKAAKSQLMILLMMAHLDVPAVRLRALQVVVDLLMWHGLAAFISDNSTADDDDAKSDDGMSIMSQQIGNLTQADLNSQGGDSVVVVLCQLLDDPDVEIRTLVAEGLCKLILCGAITSAKLFTRLILMWCNPVNDTIIKMKNILGMFFPLYASLSRANQDTIGESFMTTMKTLMDAPETSPLAMVNVEDIGLLHIQLTRPDQLQESCRDIDDLNNVHDSLAFTISNHVISIPDSFYVKNFVKFLMHLQISATNYNQLRELKELYTQMTESITDKFVLKSLEKYGARLDTFINMDPELKDREPAVENVEVAEDRRRDSIGSMASDRLSIGSLASISEQTTLGGMKKRTLFSQTQNTLLDVSIQGTPAAAASRNKRFLRASEMFVFSPQVASTQQANDASAGIVETASSGACRLSESSDSEVEFKRPNKIIRAGDLMNDSSDSDCEEMVSGILKHTVTQTISRTEKLTEKEKVPQTDIPLQADTEPQAEKVPQTDIPLQADKEPVTEKETVTDKKTEREKEKEPQTAGKPQTESVQQEKEKSSTNKRSKKTKTKETQATKVKDSDKVYDSEDDFVTPAPRPKRDEGRRPVLTEETDSPFKNRSHSELFLNKSRNSNKTRVEKENSKSASQKSSSQSSQESVELATSTSQPAASAARRQSLRIEKTPTVSSQQSEKSSQQSEKSSQQSEKSSQQSEKSSQHSEESRPNRGRKSISSPKTSTQRRQSQGREPSKEKANISVTSSVGQTRGRRSLVPLTSPHLVVTSATGKRKSISSQDSALTSSPSKRKSITSQESEETGRSKRTVKPTAKAAEMLTSRSHVKNGSKKPQTPQETSNSRPALSESRRSTSNGGVGRTKRYLLNESTIKQKSLQEAPNKPHKELVVEVTRIDAAKVQQRTKRTLIETPKWRTVPGDPKPTAAETEAPITRRQSLSSSAATPEGRARRILPEKRRRDSSPVPSPSTRKRRHL